MSVLTNREVSSALRGKIALSWSCSLALFGISFKGGSKYISVDCQKIPCVMFVYYTHVYMFMRIPGLYVHKKLMDFNAKKLYV